MANVIKLRKGLDINLKGKAEEKKIQLKSNGRYALVPDDFEGVVPKVVVKEGDKVKAGDALFVNKNYPSVKFASPVSGTVAAVERGDRRKVLSVRIDADANQEFKDFGVKDVAKMTGDDVKQLLLDAGFSQVEPISPPELPLEEAMNPATAKRNIASLMKKLNL